MNRLTHLTLSEVYVLLINGMFKPSEKALLVPDADGELIGLLDVKDVSRLFASEADRIASASEYVTDTFFLDDEEVTWLVTDKNAAASGCKYGAVCSDGSVVDSMNLWYETLGYTFNTLNVQNFGIRPVIWVDAERFIEYSEANG